MRCSGFLPCPFRLISLPTCPLTTLLPSVRFANFLPLYNQTRIRLTTLPAYPRTIRLPRVRFASLLSLYSRSRVGCLRRVRQAKTQEEPARHETDDFGSRYHNKPPWL